MLLPEELGKLSCDLSYCFAVYISVFVKPTRELTGGLIPSINTASLAEQFYIA